MNKGGRPPKKTKKTWIHCDPKCSICELHENGVTTLCYLLQDGITYVEYKIYPSLAYYETRLMNKIAEKHAEFFHLTVTKACSKCRNGLRDNYDKCK